MALTAARYALALALLLALDGLWLVTNRQFYSSAVRRVQGAPMRIRAVPAVLAYAFMYAGLVLLVLPTLEAKGNKPTLADVLRVAGIYGLTVYGVFNATNMAIFKDYGASVAVRDTLWGATLYVVTAWILTR